MQIETMPDALKDSYAEYKKKSLQTETKYRKRFRKAELTFLALTGFHLMISMTSMLAQLPFLLAAHTLRNRKIRKGRDMLLELMHFDDDFIDMQKQLEQGMPNDIAAYKDAYDAYISNTADHAKGLLDDFRQQGFTTEDITSRAILHIMNIKPKKVDWGNIRTSFSLTLDDGHIVSNLQPQTQSFMTKLQAITLHDIREMFEPKLNRTAVFLAMSDFLHEEIDAQLTSQQKKINKPPPRPPADPGL